MTRSRFKADAVETRISQTSLAALGMPKTGRTYDLSSGWWANMPMLPAHPPFQLIPYRTPAGTRNEGDLGFLTDDNIISQGFISEMLMCTVHSGTHIDAIAHCVCGPRNLWYGGDSADQYLGDFGPMKKDASELPPVISRGVMIDIPALLGVPHLLASQPIHREDLEAALERQGTEIRAGDVVLIRTGIMSHWPKEERLAACAGAGLAIDGAEWLTQHGVTMVGADNVALEVTPTTVPGVPLPVHRHLIHENGIPIIEWVFLEDLAHDRIYDFLFLCLPLTISGATGSMIRPLAIV